MMGHTARIVHDNYDNEATLMYSGIGFDSEHKVKTSYSGEGDNREYFIVSNHSPYGVSAEEAMRHYFLPVIRKEMATRFGMEYVD